MIHLKKIWKHEIADLMFISTTIFEGGQKPKAPAPVSPNELPKASRLFFSNEKNRISLWSGLISHWFPLIRPKSVYKPLFLKGGYVWGQLGWPVFLNDFFGGYLIFANKKTRWWFQILWGYAASSQPAALLESWKIFFVFTAYLGKIPFWLIFFRWVETTN